jgi:hypothetical protein
MAGIEVTLRLSITNPPIYLSPEADSSSATLQHAFTGACLFFFFRIIICFAAPQDFRVSYFFQFLSNASNPLRSFLISLSLLYDYGLCFSLISASFCSSFCIFFPSRHVFFLAQAMDGAIALWVEAVKFSETVHGMGGVGDTSKGNVCISIIVHSCM